MLKNAEHDSRTQQQDWQGLKTKPRIINVDMKPILKTFALRQSPEAKCENRGTFFQLVRLLEEARKPKMRNLISNRSIR